MNIKETAAPKVSEEKISARETDKLNALGENLHNEKTDSTTAADEKLLQRLEGQREADSPQLQADGEVNSGKPVDIGMMLCSDRCYYSRVRSGRCFHA